MVAAALAVPVEGIEVTLEGDLDLRGTLGVVIRVAFNVQVPEASAEHLASLAEKTERCCTVFQTLVQPPADPDRVAETLATAGDRGLVSGSSQEVSDDERRGRGGAFDEPEEGAEVPGGGEARDVQTGE